VPIARFPATHLRAATTLFAAILAFTLGPRLTPSVVAASAGARPAGTELYGYLPYWEMNSTMADYLADVPLTDLELFSVSAGKNGELHKSEVGYKRITGAIGTRLISGAHARGQRVQLVFTSFTFEKNTPFFGRSSLDSIDDQRSVQEQATPAGAAAEPWRRTAKELVDLATKLGVDGIDVDVELIRGDSYEGYTAFLADLRGRLDAAIPGAKLTVATMANRAGADLARAAIAGGFDRVFLMGYDYHWSGSDPGASAPIARLDDGLSLVSSIKAYADAGVPPAKTLLGLPLFGMSWTVATPSPFAPRLESGVNWVPSNHVAQLTAPGFESWFDWPETVEFIANPIAPQTSPGTSAAPGASPVPGGSVDPGVPPAPDASIAPDASLAPGESLAPGASLAPGVSAPPPDSTTWQAIFYDSPRTLRPKLALAVSRGFAGAGFWAIGYERGLPGYIELMADFRAGLVTTAPPISLTDP